MSDSEYLINYLLKENTEFANIEIPQNIDERKNLLRALMNVRPPKPVSKDFLKIQDEYLTRQKEEKGVVELSALKPVDKNIYLWQGDITTLKTGAIVNAANDRLLGCFVPGHRCIDNAIHSAAGVQLRLECSEIMLKQNHPEPTGSAKITSAYNLPCEYVIHTVGPIIYGNLTEKDCKLLKNCYSSCLEIAKKNNIKSIAFCCISTGEFHFPNDKAAEIAVKTVKDYMQKTNSEIKVVFNVFKDIDYEIYKKLLSNN